MIYGRRFFDRKPGTQSRFEHKKQQLSRSERTLAEFYFRFQNKYSLHFILATLGPFLAFCIPCVYFLFQNYGIFTHLAYDVRPELLDHLERERNFLFGFMAFCLFFSGLFCYMVTKRMTRMIVAPIWSIERHMKKVTMGDWESEDFKLPPQHEFRSLVATYSYLYRTLRTHSLKEIEALESLHLDPQDQNTSTVVKNLIETKKAQLGIQPAPEVLTYGNAAEISSTHWTRHAS